MMNCLNNSTMIQTNMIKMKKNTHSYAILMISNNKLYI
jgi:hypothetical protein